MSRRSRYKLHMNLGPALEVTFDDPDMRITRVERVHAWKAPGSYAPGAVPSAGFTLTAEQVAAWRAREAEEATE